MPASATPLGSVPFEVLMEARRARDYQNTRLATIRNAAGLLLGASGIAASLASIDGAHLIIRLSVLLMICAAIASLLALLPRGSKTLHPDRLLKNHRGMAHEEAVVSLAEAVAAEYRAQEDLGNRLQSFLLVASALFVAALGLLAVGGWV